jgi:hypothetical protein
MYDTTCIIWMRFERCIMESGRGICSWACVMSYATIPRYLPILTQFVSRFKRSFVIIITLRGPNKLFRCYALVALLDLSMLWLKSITANSGLGLSDIERRARAHLYFRRLLQSSLLLATNHFLLRLLSQNPLQDLSAGIFRNRINKDHTSSQFFKLRQP